MNYVTDRNQIFNNTILRVITKLNQSKIISTTKILMSYSKKRKKNVIASAQQASYSGPPKKYIEYRHNKIPELGP